MGGVYEVLLASDSRRERVRTGAARIARATRQRRSGRCSDVHHETAMRGVGANRAESACARLAADGIRRRHFRL
jgi:hypothetical protein